MHVGPEARPRGSRLSPTPRGATEWYTEVTYFEKRNVPKK